VKDYLTWVFNTCTKLKTILQIKRHVPQLNSNVCTLRAPRLHGGLLPDSLEHIHVALDTRLPVSYGPEANHRTSSAKCRKQRPSVSN